MQPHDDYRDILRHCLAERRRRNASYSLRAFARDIAMSPSRLSEVLSSNQRLSPASARRIATSLGMSARESDFFAALVEREAEGDAARRADADKRIAAFHDDTRYRELNPDEFHAMARWEHPALLEALDIARQPRPRAAQERWLARRLRLSPVETHGALQRLRRLGLVRSTRDGWVKTGADVATSHSLPSADVRRAHQDLVEKALDALHREPIGRRSFNALMLAMDRERLPEAFARLHAFCREFNREFGAPGHKTDAYCLALQLFPLTEADHDA